ncbi:hypothetical protein RGF97_33050 [Streptomyces roseicoloratus]|uniref:TolA protein n=1 Tax=Streptomyces roseicoloratus TaxID=2508722 RepID=A0ABY9S334_9ACTN|nr:hypothetical protein [Streptomyces roseicoloratus]WMX48662.1 hypothetical protein RGF97_33050 [Streptomyces roseicoloratus]
MDVERIADELYGLKPSEFTAARDAYVAEARRAKDSAAAKEIAALRRPPLAAWAANRLARQRKEEAGQFLTLGETLRTAHRTLDAEQLRTASRRRHQLVTALAHEAAVLAQETGQPVSDTVLREIEQILHGVLAHPDVAELWAKGRLVQVPEAAVGFAAVAPEGAPVRPTPARKSAPKAGVAEKPRPAPDEPPPKKPTPTAKRRREEEQRLRALERARAAAQEAASEVARRERELDAARQAQRESAAKRDEASERVGRLERELEQARQAELEGEAAAAEEGRAAKSAQSALHEASRTAERTGEELRRLEQPTGP